MIRRPPRSTQSRSSAASDVYKRQRQPRAVAPPHTAVQPARARQASGLGVRRAGVALRHLAQPRGPAPVSYTHLRAHETRHDLVCRLLLEKKKKNNNSPHPYITHYTKLTTKTTKHTTR